MRATVIDGTANGLLGGTKGIWGGHDDIAALGEGRSGLRCGKRMPHLTDDGAQAVGRQDTEFLQDTERKERVRDLSAQGV